MNNIVWCFFYPDVLYYSYELTQLKWIQWLLMFSGSITITSQHQCSSPWLTTDLWVSSSCMLSLHIVKSNHTGRKSLPAAQCSGLGAMLSRDEAGRVLATRFWESCLMFELYVLYQEERKRCNTSRCARTKAGKGAHPDTGGKTTAPFSVLLNLLMSLCSAQPSVKMLPSVKSKWTQNQA